eukprot:SAG22_NODE_1828_length_3492_cov_69.414677_3_plen_80_part_00
MGGDGGDGDGGDSDGGDGGAEDDDELDSDEDPNNPHETEAEYEDDDEQHYRDEVGEAAEAGTFSKPKVRKVATGRTVIF